MRIVSPEKFPFGWFRKLKAQKRGPGNPGGKQKGKKYFDLVTAFDIEATRIIEIEQSVMFIWQWCFGDRYCVIGRTWDDFLYFKERLESVSNGKTLVVFVHNLSYEFQFLRGVMDFETKDVFCIKSRKVLKALHGALEFRCSYIHSNMSLKEYLKKFSVEHQKLDGDEFDYNKQRFSWTPLTEKEMEYACNDVIGLVEAITAEMTHDGDDLYSFPLTSTGYVRRDIKKAVRDAIEAGEISYTYIQRQFPDLWLYEILREAFRGGDVHANRFFTGQVVQDADSADRSSSYPDVVCNDVFPVSEFQEYPGRIKHDELMKLIFVRHKAVVCRAAFTNIRLKQWDWPCPYLSFDKCRNVIKTAPDSIDNGRIIQADYLEISITDIDLQILMHEYDWDDVVFFDVAYARYGPLPAAIINETIKYYKLKTELKNVKGQELLYMKSKNKINSIYGMTAQDPCKVSIEYIQNGQLNKYGDIEYYIDSNKKTKAEILKQNKRRAFVVYQWGCWVTAWARLRLHEAIWEVIAQGAEFLYCDTDSVKYIGVVDWTNYNRQREKASTKSGAFATDPAGITHYMGVMEQENRMKEFASLGAKKYVYTDEAGRLHCTIAGVAKTEGAAQLAAAGGIRAFKTGFLFTGKAGGLEAVYNDKPPMNTYTIDGHVIPITSNVSLRPSTYCLGVSQEYENLLKNRQYFIDF